jgi:hypothetical protein
LNGREVIEDVLESIKKATVVKRVELPFWRLSELREK